MTCVIYFGLITVCTFSIVEVILKWMNFTSVTKQKVCNCETSDILFSCKQSVDHAENEHSVFVFCIDDGEQF
jgi:hypothetical protein